ncbi:PSD1 and planctomycete cytochrome C domain-containing protein [Novipirellula sp. SH528]|uniref:PSD1 and planctomycete cytochrome C domain-containing protein n=1 Tax=Novipirellula sp. SH528 TaxID=3454466 RepID=UPI003FA0800C
MHLLKTGSLTIAVVVVLASISSAVEPINFQRDISPLLSDKCYYCHGPDSNHREADLRLDVQSAAYASAIVPGHPDQSELFARITSDDAEMQMPPPDSGKSLNATEIEMIQRWIREGAKYEGHWSFHPPTRPTPPTPSDANWCRNPIDAFVLSRLEKEGLRPSPRGTKTTLIRRVTLDLTGVPPTRDEVADFLADDSADAFETVVDRLLDSPRYGERMAVPWLDAARYADTMGYQADWERTQWPWRTWVIDAYNQNLPFDQFTIQQLAGDLLPDPSVDQLIATGFNRNHRINDEAGIVPEEYLVEYLVDRVETTSGTWLGMTFGCARCHDHKFDPFSQKDFFKLYAFFNGVPEQGKDGRKGYAAPSMRVAVRGKQDGYELRKSLAAALQKELSLSETQLEPELQEWIGQQQLNLKKDASGWLPQKPLRIQASDTIEFEILDDHSALIVADKVSQPIYNAVISPDPGMITAVRLEALTHESFGGGLTLENGNFILTDVRVEVSRKGRKKTTRLKLSRAEADYEQNGYPVAHAIDDVNTSGWGVDGHVKKEDRVAMFVLESPLVIHEGDELMVRLAHESPYPDRAIGRFRISTTDAAMPSLSGDVGLPKNVKKAIRVAAEKRTKAQQDLLAKHYLMIAPATASLRKEIDQATLALSQFEKQFTTNVMVMQEMAESRPTHVLERGVYDQPGEVVTADVPAAMLGPLPSDAPANRLGLAKWLVSGMHPLTGRVAVNRYWAMLFGNGLVETMEDFGLQGGYPSHPELLDWLATEYPHIGWDTKAMIKMIVMSATYQQSSHVTPEMMERDPANRLLARMTRFRLPAEIIRDQALFASGLLVETIGGASVKPYQPEGLWSEISFQSKGRSTDFYVQDTGESLYRRSLYTFWKRSVPPPTMATFDAPSREACVLSRPKTNTPLQALALMNDPTFVEASRVLAEKCMRESTDRQTQIRSAFEIILSRTPTDFEQQTLSNGFQQRLSYFGEHPQKAKLLLDVGASKVDASLDSAHLAALSTCVMNLFNLDETIHHE